MEHVLLKSLQPVHPGTCEQLIHAQTVMLSPVQFTFRVAAFAHHFVLGPTSTELRLTDQDVPWRHSSVLGEAFLGLEVRRSWWLRSYKGFDAIPEAQGLYDPRNEKDR